LIAIAIAALGAWLLLGVLAVAACIRSSQTESHGDQRTSESSDEFPPAVNF